MLRHVLVDYLNNIKEREFDLPFLALLSAMGYYDIHFTHGTVEFGKDFIAKRLENGIETQFSFQTKAGDITLADWRNDIMGQMLESLLIGLSHPQFARNMPHQTVLVTTGRLIGNTNIELQDLNENRIVKIYHLLPIELWDQETLLPYLEQFGLEGLYEATTSGFMSFGNFYILYGHCLQNKVSDREIEKHSRQWIVENIEPQKLLLGAAIESEIISQKCVQQGYHFEAVRAHLGAIRSVTYQLQTEVDPVKIQWLTEVYYQTIKRLLADGRLCLTQIIEKWGNAGKNLATLTHSPGNMVAYLVFCSRIIELAGILYFLEQEAEAKASLICFLTDFITREPGCAHIPADRYAVSLVLPILALYDSGNIDLVKDLICQSTVWLCDRYQEGVGIASLEALEQDEITILFGYPFSFMPNNGPSASFLATILSDLAALIDSQLYTEVVNDIKATRIPLQYWQAQDTLGLYRIEGEDVIVYPNIEYADIISQFDHFDYAEHISYEPRSFRITQLVGPFSLMAIMSLLRDRYFPTVWPLLHTSKV